jgi:hypothetical protein
MAAYASWVYVMVLLGESRQCLMRANDLVFSGSATWVA